MRKRIVMGLAFAATVSMLAGCGAETGNATKTQEPAPVSQNTEETDISDDTLSEVLSLEDEMAGVETQSQAFEDMDWDNMSQTEMNMNSAEWFDLWDAELNSLWERLVAELPADRKDNVVSDQKDWVARKEASVKAAGSLAEGGTLQPLLESTEAKDLTRARAYYLASLLGEVRGEGYTVPSDVEASIAEADPSLDQVFQKFEGTWDLDVDGVVQVTVEPSATSDYLVDGSTWIVWITHGDLMTDLDVVSYTPEMITFQKGDIYYLLHRGIDGGVHVSYGSTESANDGAIGQ